MRLDRVSVDVSHLSVFFGDFRAVDDISFTVQYGEIFGFLGANGAGKTTTIRVLCGLLPPTSGAAKVAGLSFTRGEGTQIKARVGYMSQKFTLYDNMTVHENLIFMGSLRKMEPDLLKKRMEELLTFVGYTHSLTTFVQDLPGGMRQQVSLAAAVLHDPEILFLDEPTSGVTPVARARFWKLIRELAAKGKTVFVTTHYMDEAEQCERIALMRDGKIIALDSPDHLRDEAIRDPLFELEPLGAADTTLLEKIRKHASVQYFQVHGMRYHVLVGNLPLWEEFAKELSSSFRIRKIRPSLEDVFIRLVEGKER